MFTPVAVVDAAGSVVVPPDFTPESLAQAAPHPMTDWQPRDCAPPGDVAAMNVALADGLGIMVN